ncbi:MAG: SDR family NAD(P)-dependent oxidoreductase [Betaproteobacteria bacterium]|nr:SDR family NAD(P)-dependent oxidoreductase [Betaproteobacteria bacterium]
MKEFKNRVAVVTGGASGLGYAMCERFAREGMRIVMADISGPHLEDAAAGLRAGGAEVLAVACDVSKWEEVLALAAATKQKWGGAHIVCNNAGVRTMTRIWETSIEDWRWAVGVDLWGVIHGVRAFLPDMLARGEPGHIVNTASTAGFITARMNAPYAVSKSGVIALSETLYNELRHDKLPVSASVLCPGTVRTRLRENSAKLVPSGAPVAPHPAGKLPNERSPQEVAEMVFDAIRNDRFWILTHASVHDDIERRAESIIRTGAVVSAN